MWLINIYKVPTTIYFGVSIGGGYGNTSTYRKALHANQMLRSRVTDWIGFQTDQRFSVVCICISV